MKPILLCLHGWGGTKESFTELRQALHGVDLEILTPDLPGFGSEPEPDTPWTTDDYADWVLGWLSRRINESTNKRINVLGHSHGGRIAIKLAARQCRPEPVEGPLRASTQHSQFSILNSQLSHVYLCASAGIHRPRHFRRILGLTLAKTGTFFLSIPGLRALQPAARKLLYKLIRVHDYEKASPRMRQTLINITREDLRPLLSSITIPADIFWGEDDAMTPVADAHILHEGIRGSRLHLFPGVSHRVHRDRAQQIAAAIMQHL